MADQNPMKACSYFIVRYVPNIVSEEFVNIGLFLHSPEEDYLDCVFTDDLRRIKRFHPQADTELLRELQPYFEQQIKEHERDLDAYIRDMQESYSNLIQVTPPRPCLAAEPQSEMQELFTRYVGARLAGPPAQDTRMRIRQSLVAAFKRQSVFDHQLFEKRIPAAQWTEKGDPFCFDFGYRPLQAGRKPNGHIQLVHALSLGRDNELAKALRWTFDKVVEKEPAHLTVVHERLVEPRSPIALSSQSIFESPLIRLFPISRADEYAQSVHAELAA